MITTLTLKRGDTFVAAMQYQNDSGTNASLAGYSITSMVRNQRGNLVESFAVVIDDVAGGRYHFVDTPTDDWPEGVLVCDIRYSVAGRVTHTESFEIEILKRQTYQDVAP